VHAAATGGARERPRQGVPAVGTDHNARERLSKRLAIERKHLAVLLARPAAIIDAAPNVQALIHSSISVSR